MMLNCYILLMNSKIRPLHIALLNNYLMYNLDFHKQYNHLVLLCKNETGYKNLIKLINSLEEKYRKPAELRFIKEYAYDEIAQELNLELNTVKTRLKRAKELLKKMGNI